MLSLPAATALVAALLLSAVAAAGQPCEEGWTDEFMHTSIAYQVRVLANADLGHGPELFAGGFLSTASGFEVNNITRWNGAFWEPLGGGVADGTPGKGPVVYAIASFDDGAGPALYAGGNFLKAGGLPAKHVARWDGSQWSAVAEGAPYTVRALVVHDDGDGPALYRGGLPFDGQYSMVAHWDGGQWQTIAVDVDGPPDRGIWALASFDDGTGPALYAAGRFIGVHGAGQWVDALSIARWRDGAWEPVGDGFSGGQFRPEPLVAALHVFDDGHGPKLYAGGDFSLSGETVARRVACWDGQSWKEVGGGIPQKTYVSSLATFEDAGGPRLFATANIQVGAGSAYRLNGNQWESVGDAEQGPMFSMAPEDGRLFFGGQMSRIGDVAAGSVAMWDGQTWTGTVPPIGSIAAAEFFDDGSGLALYASSVGCENCVAGYVRRWNGLTWEPAGEPSPMMVRDLQVFDDGTGRALYAAGWWEEEGELYPCARWTGEGWEAVGNSGDFFGVTLGVFDAGDGPCLLLASKDAGPDAGVLRLEGGSWVPLTGGPSGSNTPVCFAEFDDGTGSALYGGVAGHFGVWSPIVRWNGQGWSTVPPPDGIKLGTLHIQALQVYDDGAGPALFAGGYSTKSGAVILKWDGFQWGPLGKGINPDEPGGAVSALAVGTFAGRDALVVGGAFEVAGEVTANGVALWDGQSWMALGEGIKGSAAQVLPAGDDDLIVAGFILQAGGIPSYSVAHWRGCPTPCPADCDQSGSLDLLDYLCFSALFDAADPAADCDASGSLELFDFLCFVNAFNDGCP